MSSATPATPERRRWEAHEWRESGEQRDPEESRTMMAARLRDMIRLDGFVFDPESLSSDPPRPALHTATGPVWQTPDDPRPPDGFLVRWSAGARERDTDDDGSLLRPTAVRFTVPEPWASSGGGVRLRHNLGGPVTVTAYDTAGDPVGYLFASPVDEQQEHVELHPGAAALHVSPDPD